MVLKNFPKTQDSGSVHYRMPFIHDRLAAYVLDLALVFFLHSFLAYAIKREQSLAMIEGYQTMFVFWLVCNVVFFLFLYFSYHFLALCLYKTSLGKKVFRIKLRNLWGMDEISIHQAAKYSFWKTIGILCLGLTYWGSFMDPKRRTFHERVSDTMNVTTRQRFSKAPSLRELQFFQGFLFAFQSFVIVVVASLFYQWYKIGNAEILDEKLHTQLSPQCNTLTEKLEEAGETARLDLALSLFMVGDINRDCLEKEARAALEKGENLQEANLAFALLYPQEKEKFVSEACAATPRGFACQVLEQKQAIVKSHYQILWEAKQAFLNQQYKISMNLLGQIKTEYIKTKIGYLKFQNLWFLERDKVLSSMQSLKDLFHKYTYERVSAWACLQEAEVSCDKLPSFCDGLLHKKSFYQASMEEEISYVRVRECKNQWDLALPNYMSEEAKALFFAKWHLRKHKDLMPLRELIHDGSIPFEIKGEVARTMIRHGDINNEDKTVIGRFESVNQRQPASE